MADFEVKDGVGIIPEGTTIISVAAFKDCKELTSVGIPDSVQEIGALAFAGTCSMFPNQYGVTLCNLMCTCYLQCF